KKTFDDSVLDWTEKDKAAHQRMLYYYQNLIALRKSNTVLRNLKRENIRVNSDLQKNSLILYIEQAKERLICLFNFSPSTQRFAISEDEIWKKMWDTGDNMWGGLSPTVLKDSLAHVPAQTGVILQSSTHIIKRFKFRPITPLLFLTVIGLLPRI